MKTLIAYFSCTNNTKILAEEISKQVNGDLFEIKPLIPYTKEDLNWMDKNSRSSIEMNDKNSRPEIMNKLENMEKYDTIYLGFPIWWYIAPTIINTFLESYNCSGKTIIPFCTSGSSDVGETNKYLESSCKGAILKTATRLKNSNEDTVKEWLERI